jgi:uncharacterized protein (UPF0218 family)
MSAKKAGPFLVLPDGAREAMRVPLGPVIQDFGLKKHLEGVKVLVAVGDMVTATLLDAGYDVSLAVFDYKTKRTEERDFCKRLGNIPGKRLHARNPPATVTLELWEALQTAFLLVGTGERVGIEVEGEEDLAAIPAIIMAPEGARVLYGMPGKGMVVVLVDEAARKKAGALLGLMEPREGWKDI